MTAIVDLQIVDLTSTCPDQLECQSIIEKVLDTVGITDPKECTIRVVDANESAILNEQYRGKTGATNVLSFTFESPIGMDVDLMGDIVICAPIVVEQASEQQVSDEMLWHHLIIHGCLHLLGHDHQDESEAEKMEMLECLIMKELGFPDPYALVEKL